MLKLVFTLQVASGVIMESSTMLSDEQGKMLCDEIANRLLDRLETEDLDNEINSWISNYLSSNNINANADDIAQNITWSVKVALQR